MNGRAPFRAAVAAVIAVGAFALYRATLLPGFDFGDSASFQVVTGLPIISTRDAYPLYFALGSLFFRIVGGDPAHALNLASAVEGAAACGLLALLANEISGSLLGGAGAALLFAGSYTFWSQSVIAEVYALHILFVCLSIWTLLRWRARPSLKRLTLFFAVYALGFGNHLSMILLAPACVVFLLSSAPGGWRSMFAPRIVAVAVVCAAGGALQYAWNLRSLWFGPFPPNGILDAIVAGWFDITKADWRPTMVLSVPRSMLADHAAMYFFDLHQQFGWLGIALASVGAGSLCARDWQTALLLIAIYMANGVFAFSYDVGDTHVFYLPSHLVVGILAASGIVALGNGLRPAANTREHETSSFSGVRGFAAAHGPTAVALLLISYAGLRMYHDYPALDRSADRRPTEVLDRITSGIDDRRAILLSDLNWQVQNGLNYYGTRLHPEVAFARMPDVLLYAPGLVRDNVEMGRAVMFTPRAAAALNAAYGSLVPTRIDPSSTVSSLFDQVSRLPPGTRYTLVVLKPGREFAIDGEDIARSVSSLTAGAIAAIPSGDYVAMAGLAGHSPSIVVASPRPFRNTIDLNGTQVEVRIDSWLASDTIRRMGFGHVVAGHRHTLILERGVSFVAFDGSGEALQRVYAANLFAPQPRYVCYPR